MDVDDGAENDAMSSAIALLDMSEAMTGGIALLDMSEGAQKAIVRTMKRAGSRSGSSNAGSSGVGQESKETAWRPEGKACKICQLQDSSPCSIFPGRFRKWFYQPKKVGGGVENARPIVLG